MNTNKVELSGVITNKQISLIGSTEYTHITLNVGNDIKTISLPIYVQSSLLNDVSLALPIVITGSLAMEIIENGNTPQLVVIGSHISQSQQDTQLIEPEGLFDAEIDETYFDNDLVAPSSNESEAYTLPLEAFSQSELETQYQGVFITNDHQHLDLSSNDVFTNLMGSPDRVLCDINYDMLWSMTSQELIIETLKKNHSTVEMKAMIWIALSKEIETKNVMTHEDLKRFFLKFSDIIKISTRKFNGEHIPFIHVRVSHYSGKAFFFRFISPIFSERPTSPYDWIDFKETYNHLNPKHVGLQIKYQQIEELFARSESPYIHEDETPDNAHTSASITRSAIIRMNGF